MSYVGERVYHERKSQRITLRGLGRLANLSPGFLCDLEHGRRSVSVDNLAAIARALGVPAQTLIGDATIPDDSIRSLAKAAKTIAKWLELEQGSLEDFHNYAQLFGGVPGCNVYEMVLRDALSHRGLTLEWLRESAQVYNESELRGGIAADAKRECDSIWRKQQVMEPRA